MMNPPYRSTCLLFGLLPILAGAQLPLDSAAGKIRYVEVVPVPNVSAADLHARAQTWATTHVQDARPLPDSLPHSVTMLGSLLRERKGKWGTLTLGRVQYQLTLTAREGRYRYELIPFLFERFEGPNKVVARIPLPQTADADMSRNLQRQLDDDLANLMTTYLASLRQHMSTQAVAAPAAPKPKPASTDW